jgi:hypothetical protein
MNVGIGAALLEEMDMGLFSHIYCQKVVNVMVLIGFLGS